jgi:formylglycine-generating enzyme required for sulfatase activity
LGRKIALVAGAFGVTISAAMKTLSAKAKICGHKMKTKFQFLFVVLALFAGVYSGVSQVANLGIATAGNSSVLFWPTSATNYVLETTTNLATPNWVTVSNAIPITAVTVTNTLAAGFFRLVQNTNPPVTTSDGMALIPAGAFTMGDNLDGETDALPISVSVSAFYMDTNLVSYSQWYSVYTWATTNGYAFDHAGLGKGGNYPVETLNWYDCVKWCNARSRQAGLTPVYYTDAGLTKVYTNGDVDAVYANWTTNGYRLPTEAEWEKAARGGLSGQRFPWGNTISETQANYYANTSLYSYDLGPNGYNSIGSYGGTSPATSPVGSFPPNGYGLFDMAGNVAEWCWDWYGTYLGGTDPRGPASGSSRASRGGYWNESYFCAYAERCACRGDGGIEAPPTIYNPGIGFRCVREP